MSASVTVSRTESGSADAVRAVSVVSTGTVQIHPEHPFGTRKPLYWWMLTSRRWTPPRPVNVYVIEHAKALVLFDTGQDRASVTDDAYFPGGFTGLQISLEPTSDPALAPFTESLDVMGDGSLVLLATPGHTDGSLSLLIRRGASPPLLLVGDLTYGAELLERRQVPAHDPTAAARLLGT
jgi:hypothetical protein